MQRHTRNYSTRLIRAQGIVNFPPRYSSREVAAGQARVLQQLYGHQKQPSIALSDDTGITERAARNHLSGAHSMRLHDFFSACQRIPALAAWGGRMMGLKDGIHPAFEAELNSLIRTYYAITEQGETGA